MPDVARVLPIARELRSEGIQRYGFHGLSCESIVQQLATELPDCLVIAHLGNGASVRKQLAGMIAALDGVDSIVFTGGIGENDAVVRAGICAGLTWIGVSLDHARNQSARNPLQDAAARCTVQVLASREDEQIARHSWQLVHEVSSPR